MLKFVLLALLTVTSIAHASELKSVLVCSEKFSSLTITQNEDIFEIKRSIRTNRVNGNIFVNGVVDTESYGTLDAKLKSHTSNSLTFQFNNGHFLKFSLTPTNDNFLEIKMSSNEKDLINNLNEIFKTSENSLTFYQVDACTILSK